MEYITDAKPKNKKIDKILINEINNKINSNIRLTSEERNMFLDYYVQLSRNILAEYLQIDITENPLINRCDLAQHIIGKLLEKNKNILVYPKESQEVIYPTCKGHSFLVCIIQDVPYLIDLTYRQFFLKENCTERNYFIKDNKVLLSPDPGYFMMNKINSMEIANKIISDGYIELDINIAKKYGDSFYYTKTGDCQIFDIPGNIYFKSMMKENNNYAVDDERFYEMYGKVM